MGKGFFSPEMAILPYSRKRHFKELLSFKGWSSHVPYACNLSSLHWLPRLPHGIPSHSLTKCLHQSPRLCRLENQG